MHRYSETYKRLHVPRFQMRKPWYNPALVNFVIITPDPFWRRSFNIYKTRFRTIQFTTTTLDAGTEETQDGIKSYHEPDAKWDAIQADLPALTKALPAARQDKLTGVAVKFLQYLNSPNNAYTVACSLASKSTPQLTTTHYIRSVLSCTRKSASIIRLSSVLSRVWESRLPISSICLLLYMRWPAL